MRVWVEDARVGRTLLADAFDAEFSLVPETMTWVLTVAPVAFAFPSLTASQVRRTKPALSEAKGSVRPTPALLIRRRLLAVAPSFCHYVQIAIELN